MASPFFLVLHLDFVLVSYPSTPPSVYLCFSFQDLLSNHLGRPGHRHTSYPSGKQIYERDACKSKCMPRTLGHRRLTAERLEVSPQDSERNQHTALKSLCWGIDGIESEEWVNSRGHCHN